MQTPTKVLLSLIVPYLSTDGKETWGKGEERGGKTKEGVR
jgi:hypothetical protein